MLVRRLRHAICNQSVDHMHVYILKNNQQLGPYSEDELLERITSGALTPDDFCRREGMAEWQPVNLVFSLHAQQVSPAPVTILESEPPPLKQPLSRGLIYLIPLGVIILGCGVLFYARTTKRPQETPTKSVEKQVETEKQVEYIHLISAGASVSPIETKPLLSLRIEDLRKLFGAEAKSKALEPTERVKAFLWKNITAAALGVSISEEATFNVEAQTYSGNTFLISLRQTSGNTGFVTRPIDDDVTFALVGVISGSFSRSRWEKQDDDSNSSGGTYFLRGKGLYWMNTLADFRKGYQKGWWREVVVFEQGRVIYGVRTVIPEWGNEQAIGGVLTE